MNPNIEKDAGKKALQLLRMSQLEDTTPNSPDQALAILRKATQKKRLGRILPF